MGSTHAFAYLDEQLDLDKLSAPVWSASRSPLYKLRIGGITRIYDLARTGRQREEPSLLRSGHYPWCREQCYITCAQLQTVVEVSLSTE